MSTLVIGEPEARELYVLLKPREQTLDPVLAGLLARVERLLYERLTVEEIEELGLRFSVKS